MQVCKPCHYALVESVEPFKLHRMSMTYRYKMFEHLLRLWMGIWLHTDTVTTTDASPDLGKLGEILPDASVQNMPLCFDWCCRTFQTASHVHVIHIWGVWAPSQVVDGHMASHSHHYHLSWECWSFKCQKNGWIDRHVCVSMTCCQHVSQHVGNTTKNSVNGGTDNVEPTCRMRICGQHVGIITGA